MRKQNILYVPLPGCLKFQKIFDSNEYLQMMLEQDHTAISVWLIKDDCDMRYLNDTLNKSRIKFRIKKED